MAYLVILVCSETFLVNLGEVGEYFGDLGELGDVFGSLGEIGDIVGGLRVFIHKYSRYW